MRALAQRSAEAAKEIKTLIHASAQQVQRGVALVGQTGTALQRIVSQIHAVHTAITEIAASAKEQSTGLHQVNTAVNQMDQVTQQNAAMVEESTAASHGLTQETEALAKLANHFQVKRRLMLRCRGVGWWRSKARALPLTRQSPKVFGNQYFQKLRL